MHSQRFWYVRFDMRSNGNGVERDVVGKIIESYPW